MKVIKDSSSAKGGDCNAIILSSVKKRSKKKCTSQKAGRAKTKKSSKLCDSQKRKMRKWEEEKEKAVLLSKSIEILEKYKIPDAAYSLLQSSRNIGQVETTWEKRQRAVRFAKVGLELPYHDQAFKRGDNDGNASCETEPDFGKFQLIQEFDVKQSVRTKKAVINSGSISVVSSQDITQSSAPDLNSRVEVALTAEEVAAKSINSSDSACERPTVNFTLMSCSQTAPSVVHVLRPNEVENKRKDLPIIMMEQEIMEAINYNSAVIICGETGCGKTTQVPQFLYEAGFGSNQSSLRNGIIGVTQPRRVAVLSTAKRVAFELGLRLGKEVGFQVRHDKMIGDSCSIKFMTDGILLREVQSDILLKRYSVIILDEAHERSLNTDILIGMLSRVVQLRQSLYKEQQKTLLAGKNISSENIISPLKLILMSATLRVEDFSTGKRLFPNPPPVIEVPTRQYPVTMHFSKRTEVVDYIGQAYKKVLSINNKLPPGGILVFVTGQREVEHLCRKLREASRELFLRKSGEKIKDSEVNRFSQDDSIDGIDLNKINEAFDPVNQHTERYVSDDEGPFDSADDDDESDISYNSDTDSELELIADEGDSLDQETLENDGSVVDHLEKESTLASLMAAFEALSGKNAPILQTEKKQDPNPSSLKMHREKSGGQQSHLPSEMTVLPLYAMLPASEQLRIFEETKEGSRLVVVATNVAETSLTIPGIKYVVDSGREKVKNYNSLNGMETFEVQWISKASASQRAGRAGRTGPGHCYRLYSSAVFTNIFHDFSAAEIMKMPVDGVVLFMKSMGISKVSNFPFPTPPKATAIGDAEQCLMALDALDNQGRLTSLGKAMARYPLSPRHSRMLLTVIQTMRENDPYNRANLILAYAVAAASALSLKNPFTMQFEGENENSNALDGENIPDKKLRRNKVKEAIKVSRARFSHPTSDSLTIAYALQCFELCRNQTEFCTENGLHLKTMEEMSKLRKQLLQLVLSARGLKEEFSWNHGKLEDVENAWRISSNKHPLSMTEEEILGQAICAGWVDRVAKRIRGFSEVTDGERKISAVRYQPCMVKETVFLHRFSSVSNSAPEFLVYSELIYTRRPYIHGATSVKPEWLVKCAGSLCTFSAPLTDPKPYYDPFLDQVFSWVIPTFGPHLWQLPLHGIPINDDSDRVAIFAYNLLEGHVLPCLKSVREFMAARPSSILGSEALGQKRVGNLITKLKTGLRIIDSCATLRESWNENPKELYFEIREWFQQKFHGQFEKLWAQMQREIVLEPRERFPKRVKSKKRREYMAC